MEPEEIFTKVRGIVAEQFGVAPEKVQPETTFRNDLGSDSLDEVELLMEIEDCFDVTITDEAAQKVTSVQDVLDWLKANA